MNRVIKFRAWNGEQMIYTTNEFRSEQFLMTAGDVLNRYDTVMQYTGLTDKHGVEIYEGDVLVSTFGNGLPFVIKFGEYHDSSGDDDLATAIGFYILEQDGTESLFGKSVNGDTDCYQVIGNVFQNLSNNHL